MFALMWDYAWLEDVMGCKDTVEVSQDLKAWTSLTNVPVLLIDHRGTNWIVRGIDHGFYRVRRDSTAKTK